MQKFLTILSWIFSILMLITTLGAFTGGNYLSGVFCLLIVACAFPPLWAFLKSKNISAPLWSKWVAVIVLFGCFGAAMPKVINPSTADATAQKEAPKPAAVKASSEELNEAGKSLMNEISLAAKPCDNIGKQFATASENPDMYEWYRLANAGAKACDTAAADIQLIQPGNTFSQDGKKKLKIARDNLATAYLHKAESFEKIKIVANGDMRPSAISEATEAIETSSSALVIASAALMINMQEEGVDISTLTDN